MEHFVYQRNIEYDVTKVKKTDTHKGFKLILDEHPSPV